MHFLLLFVLSVAVFTQAAFIPNTDLDPQWENFKAKYGRSYSGLEERVRRQNYEENTAFITQHNKEFADGLHAYTVAENHLADLSYEERSAMNRARAPLRQNSPTIQMPRNAPKAVEVDYRNDPCMPPVKNQGMCGACWAFSAIGVLEFEVCKTSGIVNDLSEQNLVDCSDAYGNFGCNGGWYGSAYDYIIGNNGVDTEVSYPYSAGSGECHFNPATVGAVMKSYIILNPDADSMVDALNAEHIINVAIDASRPGFSFYSSGVYDDPSCTTNVDHAVIVVGYGTVDSSGTDYWIVRNSWGGAWGEAGYIRMRRGVDLCAIEDYPMIIVL